MAGSEFLDFYLCSVFALFFLSLLCFLKLGAIIVNNLHNYLGFQLSGGH